MSKLLCRLGYHSDAIFMPENATEGYRYCKNCGKKSIEIKNIYINGEIMQRVVVAGIRRRTRMLSPEEIRDFLEHYRLSRY